MYVMELMNVDHPDGFAETDGTDGERRRGIVSVKRPLRLPGFDHERAKRQFGGLACVPDPAYRGPTYAFNNV